VPANSDRILVVIKWSVGVIPKKPSRWGRPPMERSLNAEGEGMASLLGTTWCMMSRLDQKASGFCSDTAAAARINAGRTQLTHCPVPCDCDCDCDCVRLVLPFY
jgi:hypothetical protein